MYYLQTRKKKSILSIAGGCIVILGIFLIGQFLAIKPCITSRYFPSIKDLGTNSATLRVDHEVRILPLETYKAEFTHEKIDIRLLWIGQQTATFLYREQYTGLGEALPQATQKILCKKTINVTDASYRSPEKAVWLRPEDFIGWNIYTYMEIPNWKSGYPFNTEESWHIQAKLDQVSSSLKVPYEVWIDVEVYENETIAREDFENFSAWNYGYGPLPDKIELNSRLFDQHVAHSRIDWGTIGRYIGKYQRYVFILNLDHPEDHTIPDKQRIDTLQALILLLEEKATTLH
ncbi:MAG: hypothetical protein HY869_10300 [Chloroflexi bacterium]|nr:hypothetical protein [Chloroflexota bacterium]